MRSFSSLTRVADQPPVGLELGLARPAHADAALLPLEVGPAAHQPRRQVLELRQLDLELALRAVRALREDVEDQAGAVDDAAFERALEVALLRPGQRVIEDDEVGAGRAAQRAAISPTLPRAGEQRRIGAACGAP